MSFTLITKKTYVTVTNEIHFLNEFSEWEAYVFPNSKLQTNFFFLNFLTEFMFFT
jgi:hypothetical protein